MAEKITHDSDEQSLNDNGDFTLQIRTHTSVADVIVLIDDGSGGAPAGYELVVEVYDEDDGTWMQYASEGSDSSPETARSWVDPAIPDKMRYRLINRSGGSATFRMRLLGDR